MPVASAVEEEGAGWELEPTGLSSTFIVKQIPSSKQKSNKVCVKTALLCLSLDWAQLGSSYVVVSHMAAKLKMDDLRWPYVST